MSDSNKESEGLSYNARTGQMFKDGQPVNTIKTKINWTIQDQALLDELTARRTEFREQRDASIAKFLNRLNLPNMCEYWYLFEENADEVIDLLKPFSRRSSTTSYSR